jgi:hypothetical protein
LGSWVSPSFKAIAVDRRQEAGGKRKYIAPLPLCYIKLLQDKY